MRIFLFIHVVNYSFTRYGAASTRYDIIYVQYTGLHVLVTNLTHYWLLVQHYGIQMSGLNFNPTRLRLLEQHVKS